MHWKELFTPAAEMSPQDTDAFIAAHDEGTYTLLDVRQPGEHEKERIPGSLLIPLPGLPSRIGELDPKKPVVVYCASGGRSRVAAQLLMGQGFGNVYNLKGGMHAWLGAKALGPVEQGMGLVTGSETPAEILVIAFGMETGLERFYRSMSLRVHDRKSSELFSRLADIEVRHARAVFDTYARVSEDRPTLEAFEGRVEAHTMEGGLTAEEFLATHEFDPEKLEDVLTAAMMLETQSLDLFMRYSFKTEVEDTRQALLRLCDEEKAHLSALGDLLEETVGAE